MSLGILGPATLAPEIDTSVLLGFAAARSHLGFDGHPTTIYIRTDPDEVDYVHSLLARAANPENPSQVGVSRPSDALVARTVGVANTMVISVIERRSEIGLRRALGATRGHIRLQFLNEAILLSLLGAAVLIGALAGLLPALRAARMSPTETLWTM